MHSQDHKAKLDYVWYACYGSNLAQGRFLCYLQGGQYTGNRKAYKGSRNKAAPTHSEKYMLNHPLYFAKEAHIWGGGGVCFISNEPASGAETLVRLYRITRDQFADLHAQECNKKDPAFIDFEKARQQGYWDAYSEKWYGRILFLGLAQKEPVFTFNHVGDLAQRNPPAPNYLKSLIDGLRQSHQLSPEKIAEYLVAQDGVRQKYSLEDLKELARP